MGRTLGEIRDEMPLRELLGWFNYFEQRPPGWREDQRTAMLLSAQGVKEPGHKLFPSLSALKANDPSGFHGSAMQNFLRSAKGGDQLPFLQ